MSVGNLLIAVGGYGASLLLLIVAVGCIFIAVLAFGDEDEMLPPLGTSIAALALCALTAWLTKLMIGG